MLTTFPAWGAGEIYLYIGKGQPVFLGKVLKNHTYTLFYLKVVFLLRLAWNNNNNFGLFKLLLGKTLHYITSQGSGINGTALSGAFKCCLLYPNII